MAGVALSGNKTKPSNHEEYGPVVVKFLVRCSLLGSPRDAHVS